MERRLCPNHIEDTPSFVVYPDGYGHCYGCGYRSKVTDCDLKEQERYVEDIEPMVAYIESLPKSSIRSLSLPSDDFAYYILWPAKDYYKRAIFDRESGSKYKGPAGVPKPMFKGQLRGSKTLAVCEGEINALSLELVSNMDIVSPGGASDFYSKRLEKDLTLYRNYDSFIVIVDADPAGVLAAIELKSRLKAEGKVDIAIQLMDTDANDILVQDGIEKLKEKARQMGML